MLSILITLFYLPLNNMIQVSNYALAITLLVFTIFTVFYFIALIY